MYESEQRKIFQRSLFIPASRSFFANLQKNVFSFLASNIDIDPFLKEFGSDYENAKRIFPIMLLHVAENKEQLDHAKRVMEQIIFGEYLYEDGKDWIQSSSKRKVNLVNASSGQQEALPMLLVLLVRFFMSSKAKSVTFFIEEPEAHLFPTAQKHIVNLFTLIYNTGEHNFFITTHSPYILTAVNNMLMASNLIEEKGDEILPKVEKIVGKDHFINYKDVSAYTIRDGILESILDPETGLVGASIIDSVSDDFDKVFDQLIELQVYE